jgi:2'-5' RNA ligase
MGDQARLFFALWPAPGVRGALDQLGRKLRTACGGRQMRANNIHLTLVFLGNVELARLDALRAVADAVRVEPFAMILERLGWWKHNRVAWAAPETAPEPLQSLVRQLQEGLRGAGFAFDDRPFYVPHITLLRNARCEAVEWPPFGPLEWSADEFVLVRSATREEGATYEAIGRWPLIREK